MNSHAFKASQLAARSSVDVGRWAGRLLRTQRSSAAGRATSLFQRRQQSLQSYHCPHAVTFSCFCYTFPASACPLRQRGGRGSRFRDRVPLPWLALVGFQAVEFCLAAYEVETEDLGELIQR